jgi:uncharacterized protein DUF1236
MSVGTWSPERIAAAGVSLPRSRNRQEEPMTHFRHAAMAAALLAGVGGASAQTTVITREPVETRTVVTTQPLQLTPVQRHTIYRTIVREPVEGPPPTVEYRVGTRVPAGARLYTVPQAVGVEVPAIRSYRYMRVNNHIVLVDPATSEVVADFGD